MTKQFQNKKAFHDYEIIETYEAGLVLQGLTVKNIATRGMHVQGHIIVRNEELFWVGAHVNGIEEDLTIKLLMHKQEISRLMGKIQEKGFTLIPLKVYNNRKYKVEIALAKGKKDFDKREADKNRSIDLENRRIVKSQRSE